MKSRFVLPTLLLGLLLAASCIAQTTTSDSDSTSTVKKSTSQPVVSRPPPAPARPTPPPPSCGPGFFPDSNGACRPNTPYRRPIIIEQDAANPRADVAPAASDDWEGCRKTKLNQLAALRNGDTDNANHLDEWLWKNCRSYSSELRDLEQDRM